MHYTHHITNCEKYDDAFPKLYSHGISGYHLQEGNYSEKYFKHFQLEYDTIYRYLNYYFIWLSYKCMYIFFFSRIENFHFSRYFLVVYIWEPIKIDVDTWKSKSEIELSHWNRLPQKIHDPKWLLCKMYAVRLLCKILVMFALLLHWLSVKQLVSSK